MTLLVTCASQDELARDLILGMEVVIAALFMAVVALLVLLWRTQ